MAERLVWIVDDSPLDAERTRRAMASVYDTQVFPDGAAALEQLASGRAPDVIVLDWVMPGVTGVDVCRYLRANRAHDNIAVLMLTGQRASGHVAEGLSAGANDYLSKPFVEEELLARVASLLRARALVERVERAEDSLRNLLANLPDPLLVFDAHDRVIFATGNTERIFAQSPAALVGRPLAELLPGLAIAEGMDAGEASVVLPDLSFGDSVYAPTLRRVARLGMGQLSLRDVTEQRRVEHRRLDLYSIVAHDLRSPLSTILLRTEMMQSGRRGVLSAETISDVRRIEGNVRSMVALINDFLDLARLDARGFELERTTVDAAALIHAVVDEVRPLIEASQLDISIDAGSESLALAADRHRLAQVLNNLLSNAIKFTPAGGQIRVQVRAVVADDARELEFRVEDSGRGIGPAQQATLFRRYTSVGEGRGRGTGLGLMIVREIVEAHGGAVGVESKPGKGSSFWFRLPGGTAEELARAGSEVMVVDDDPDMRESVESLLTEAGFSVRTAANGSEALGMLNRGPLPAVLVLDMRMPVMSGLELLEAMRGSPRLAQLPVCAMSGDLPILASAPAGALVLQKPLPIARLLDFIGKHARPLKRA